MHAFLRDRGQPRSRSRPRGLGPPGDPIRSRRSRAGPLTRPRLGDPGADRPAAVIIFPLVVGGQEVFRVKDPRELFIRRAAPRAAAFAAAAAALLAGGLFAQTRSASETYLTYLDTCATLKTLGELKPFLPKAMGELLARIPRELQTQMIQQSREKSVARVKATKETRLGEATILELEGTRGGKPVRGWAKMIVEDGEFKVLKDDWTGGVP